jgi:hypothetical protein
MIKMVGFDQDLTGNLPLKKTSLSFLAIETTRK